MSTNHSLLIVRSSTRSSAGCVAIESHATSVLCVYCQVKDSADNLKLATTIAIRYGAVRRTGFSLPSSTDSRDSESMPERQLLDYSTHRFRLFPLLATAYAFHFTGMELSDMHKALEDGLLEGDTSALPDVHATW